MDTGARLYMGAVSSSLRGKPRDGRSTVLGTWIKLWILYGSKQMDLRIGCNVVGFLKERLEILVESQSHAVNFPC
jgi:hypothetical protein